MSTEVMLSGIGEMSVKIDSGTEAVSNVIGLYPELLSGTENKLATGSYPESVDVSKLFTVCVVSSAVAVTLSGDTVCVVSSTIAVKLSNGTVCVVTSTVDATLYNECDKSGIDSDGVFVAFADGKRGIVSNTVKSSNDESGIVLFSISMEAEKVYV